MAKRFPSVVINGYDISVSLDGVPLKCDENYIIARQGFWKAWRAWSFRPWRIARAWADRDVHYVEFRYPPPPDATVTVSHTKRPT